MVVKRSRGIRLKSRATSLSRGCKTAGSIINARSRGFPASPPDIGHKSHVPLAKCAKLGC